MTFIIAMQADDSVIVSADNKLLISSTRGIYGRSMHADKIHQWRGGALTGTGEYCIIYRMCSHLGKFLDHSSLPARLEREKERRRAEVGECDQIDITQLVLSAPTKNGPRLHIVNSQTVEQATPGELLIFFPLDCDFSPASSEAIRDLNSSIRARGSFLASQEWIDFYVAKFSEIYQLQSHDNDQMISRSFHIHFQTDRSAQTLFISNHP